MAFCLSDDESDSQFVVDVAIQGFVTRSLLPQACTTGPEGREGRRGSTGLQCTPPERTSC